MPLPHRDLAATFGQIDIYLFDQILRGRIPPGSRLLDAGCGFGRNLVFLLQYGVEVFAADADPDPVESVRGLAARLAPALPADNFRVEPVEAMTFPDAFADVVVSSAVLHFARNDDEFARMLDGSWRALRPGGMFFCRLASLDGIAHLAQALGENRFHLPDGTDRYLVDEARLVDLTAQLGGDLLDPLKTTIVHGQRSMATWVVRKRTVGAA